MLVLASKQITHAHASCTCHFRLSPKIKQIMERKRTYFKSILEVEAAMEVKLLMTNYLQKCSQVWDFYKCVAGQKG